MKPFNLAAALRGEAVVTRDGEKVTELYCFKSTISSQKIFVCVGGIVYRLLYNGKVSECAEYNNDLFMAPKVKTYYANVYKNKEGKIRIMPHCYDSCEAAYENSDTNNEWVEFIKIIPFEVEE